MRINTVPMSASKDWTKSRWQKVGNVRPPFTIEFNGIASGDHVQIFASNNPAEQAPNLPGTAGNTEGAYVGHQVGADVTADGFVIIKEPYAWLVCFISVQAGTNVIKAWLHQQMQDN